MNYTKLNLLMICMLFIYISCDNDENKCTDIRQKGEYTIEIYKYGSYSDFSIYSVVDAGNCSSSFFYNGDGDVFNQPHELNNSENKLPYTKYYTNNSATFLSFKMIAMKIGENAKDSMKIRSVGFFNDRKLFEIEHVFYSWEEDIIKQYEKFNTYSTDLSFYLLK